MSAWFFLILGMFIGGSSLASFFSCTLAWQIRQDLDAIAADDIDDEMRLELEQIRPLLEKIHRQLAGLSILAAALVGIMLIVAVVLM